MRAILLIGMFAAASVAGAAQNPSAVYIQRTMKALDESTAENPAHVRIMFYGQSITAQAWTRIVQQQLEEKYPTVQFEFRNAAIGGYTSNVLIRTADHDLYPWYPDLLFFHVYGPMEQYEEIIRRVRERTSAEIVIWTSHLNSLSREQPNEINTSHDARAAEIRALAPKYNCMLIDLREKWRKQLADQGLGVKDLLSDTVHLNPKGCELYARLITEELVRGAELGDNSTASGTITSVPSSAPAVKQAADGSLTLRFAGNRVIAVSDGTGTADLKATVLLDGQPMDSVKELWAISRPSVGPARIWMPALNNIAFDAPLVEEDWTLTCLPDSTPDGKQIHFQLRGSVTGQDGEGWNTQRFVSRSGRVIIEPSDWRIAWTLGYRKATLPDEFQVTWHSYPLFARQYVAQPAGTRTLLVQGCDNQAHTLTLVPQQGSRLGISEFVVHAPASLAAQHENSAQSPTDWLKEAKIGAFMHFLPDNADSFAKVNDFDVEALASQLDEMGAKYLVFTLGQNSGWFNAPNAAYDRVTGYRAGERCARRDLPLDLYRALHAKGIRLMLYLPCQTPNEDVRAQRAFGLPEGPKDQPIDVAFARRWAEVIHEWSARYGDKVPGWWFDGGYAWVGFNEDIARIYAEAVKRGNPQAIVTFNPGVSLIRHTKAEDYTAGELNDPFAVLPTSRWVDGSQWHVLTHLGTAWGQRDVRQPTERWREWFLKVTAHGGAVSLDMGPNENPADGPIGAIAPVQAKQFQEIARQ